MRFADHHFLSMRSGAILVGLALLALGGVARAGTHSFLISPAASSPEGAAEARAVKMAVYIDPEKVIWISWSALDKVSVLGGEESIDGSETPLDLASRRIEASVVSPWGNRSDPLVFGQTDPNGDPVGNQSIVFGTAEMTPDVTRYLPSGLPRKVSETGPLNDFIVGEGVGYYIFEVAVRPATANPAASLPLYLLVRTIDDYRQPDPIMLNQPGDIWAYPRGESSNNGGSNSLSGYIPDDDDDGDDDDDDDRDGRFFPPPPPPPPPGEDPGGPIFPPLPITDEPGDPTVPEPATVLLMGLGLAGMAALRRGGAKN
jgi:hypothetical protein